MGNKKARNEALLAALTKFMAWTGQAPQQSGEDELRGRISSIKATLEELKRGLVHTQDPIFVNYENTYNTMLGLLESAIMGCDI